MKRRRSRRWSKRRESFCRSAESRISERKSFCRRSEDGRSEILLEKNNLNESSVSMAAVNISSTLLKLNFIGVSWKYETLFLALWRVRVKRRQNKITTRIIFEILKNLLTKVFSQILS